ncbi:MAG: cryptochrome/photolyase family protein [Flavobacteriia bacterium]|nr:cryptochrome/photolyase family protein [Flavobacteriia bacterium]
MNVGLIFPHQLFEENPLLPACEIIYLVEEYLYFRQYPFHKRKIAFHRSSMKQYEDWLLVKGKTVKYISSNEDISDIRHLIPYVKSLGNPTLYYVETTDQWLEKRISLACQSEEIKTVKFGSPMFLNDIESLTAKFGSKKKLFQADFYKQQRTQRSILVDTNQQPLGGKWSFDEENRSKFPKKGIAPEIKIPRLNEREREANAYTETYFSKNPGKLGGWIEYPTTFGGAKEWLQRFFTERFADFGTYEDAIVKDELVLHHSVLTPMLNVGLLTPQFVLDEALGFAEKHHIPMNSLEGFVRQIMGWREFIRMVYEIKGKEERTRNYWGFKRKIPAAFWNGTTGIAPIDITLKKAIDTGYCHHIERLMVLGNFMLLCEFDPDEVYEWFMIFFIDAYDWVMVPNIYGMSQFADGGMMSTKPYISGSNYLMKMSDYEKGDWQATWDGLFWHFMDKQRSFFLSNPRLGMLVHTFDKMSTEKQEIHLTNARNYLASLDEIGV